MTVTGTMDITADLTNGACLLVVSGDIDLSSVNVFIERLFELSVDGDKKIVLDLTSVDFIDSTVVHALFAAAPRIRANEGDMVLVISRRSAARRALELSGADEIYEMVRTQREALERLGVTPDRTV